MTGKVFWNEERLSIIRAMAREGKGAPEIGEYFGKSPDCIRYVCRYRRISLSDARGSNWTRSEVATMEQMAADGFTIGEVAEKVDRSRDSVRRKAKFIGLAFVRQNCRKIPKKPRGGTRKMRTCLIHGGEFESSWAGERVCPTCKQSKAWKSGQQDFSVGL